MAPILFVGHAACVVRSLSAARDIRFVQNQVQDDPGHGAHADRGSNDCSLVRRVFQLRNLGGGRARPNRQQQYGRDNLETRVQ